MSLSHWQLLWPDLFWLTWLPYKTQKHSTHTAPPQDASSAPRSPQMFGKSREAKRRGRNNFFGLADACSRRWLIQREPGFALFQFLRAFFSSPCEFLLPILCQINHLESWLMNLHAGFEMWWKLLILGNSFWLGKGDNTVKGHRFPKTLFCDHESYLRLPWWGKLCCGETQPQSRDQRLGWLVLLGTFRTCSVHRGSGNPEDVTGGEVFS